jgi:hypothetical protein
MPIIGPGAHGATARGPTAEAAAPIQGAQPRRQTAPPTIDTGGALR